MALRRGGRLPRALGRRALSDLPALRLERAEEISQLAEVVECDRFAQQLRSGCCEPPASAAPGLGGLSAEDAGLALDAGFLTFLTHVESRISSAVGHGFYTIGPCGEETMAAVGLALRPTDAMALHYRHLATQITRQLRSGKSVQQVLLDRARAHVVSASDPVTAGVHCSIGGGPNDFIVTSTLASQCPPALGRALGNQLAHGLPGTAKADLPLPKDAVSFVSVGDGSVNNAHFLSAVNLAGYARHRGYKTPIVFAVTNNEVCISLRGHGWLHPFLDKLHMPLFTADGMDLGSVRCCCPPLLSAHSALRRTCVVTRVVVGCRCIRHRAPRWSTPASSAARPVCSSTTCPGGLGTPPPTGSSPTSARRRWPQPEPRIRSRAPLRRWRRWGATRRAYRSWLSGSRASVRWRRRPLTRHLRSRRLSPGITWLRCRARRRSDRSRSRERARSLTVRRARGGRR